MREQYPDTQNDGLTFEMHSYQNGSNGSRVSFLKVNCGQHSWYSGTSYDIDYEVEIIKFFTNTLDVTDLNESTEPALAIYPNPARDIIQLDTDDEVFIYDLNGKMVLQGSGRHLHETHHQQRMIFYGFVSKTIITFAQLFLVKYVINN